MQRFIAALSIFLLMGFVSSSMAGPAEEVAKLATARGQAFEEGMVDRYVAYIAENGVLTSSLSALRIEGKAAYKRSMWNCSSSTQSAACSPGNR